MPCRGEEYSDSYYAEQRRREIDTVTRLLCGLCRNIEKLCRGSKINIKAAEEVKRLITSDTKLNEWWERHKELDAKREEEKQAKKHKQRLRREALKKLTAEEMEALGIK